MSKTIVLDSVHGRDPRSHDEIMLAARQMRADHIRVLFRRLCSALSGGEQAHGAILTPQAR